MQSNLDQRLHVGIIMDGNGRWATAKGWPRLVGHEAGIEAVRRVVAAAPAQGIGTLTVFAFSSDNWKRPQPEVAGMMRLLRCYLREETGRLCEGGIRLTLIGRRDRLPEGLPDEISAAEAATAGGAALHLRVAIDYCARDAILRAAGRVAGPADLTREGFSRLVTGEPALRDVDLVIRTSGEKRLSDFMLWESAYAELHFTDVMWPDFGADDLAAALASFHRRERRFGGLPASAQAA